MEETNMREVEMRQVLLMKTIELGRPGNRCTRGGIIRITEIDEDFTYHSPLVYQAPQLKLPMGVNLELEAALRSMGLKVEFKDGVLQNTYIERDISHNWSQELRMIDNVPLDYDGTRYVAVARKLDRHAIPLIVDLEVPDFSKEIDEAYFTNHEDPGVPDTLVNDTVLLLGMRDILDYTF